MKLVLLLLCAYSTGLLAQMEQYNFKVEDDKVVWEKIYHFDSVNIVSFYNHVIRKNQDTTISFQVKDESLNQKKYKLNLFNTREMALQPFRYDVSVSVKGERYRVRTTNIIASLRNIFNPLILMDAPYDGDIKKGKIKTGNLIDRNYKALDMHFNDRFGVKNVLKDEW